MKFLKKQVDSEITRENLSYNNRGHRDRIREVLKTEQLGFCAYSERFFMKTDTVDIEHFDPRIKNTEEDSYLNWYATLDWMNSHKRKNIEPFIPILLPYSENLTEQIKYAGGIFYEVNAGDTEAKNLINFLGVNKYEVVEDRKNHMDFIRDLKSTMNDEDFFETLRTHKKCLSYASALEVELGINIFELLEL